VCTIGRIAKEGAAHTSNWNKDGRNSSRGGTIVREQSEGERKTEQLAHSLQQHQHQQQQQQQQQRQQQKKKKKKKKKK